MGKGLQNILLENWCCFAEIHQSSRKRPPRVSQSIGSFWGWENYGTGKFCVFSDGFIFSVVPSYFVVEETNSKAWEHITDVHGDWIVSDIALFVLKRGVKLQPTIMVIDSYYGRPMK